MAKAIKMQSSEITVNLGSKSIQKELKGAIKNKKFSYELKKCLMTNIMFQEVADKFWLTVAIQDTDKLLIPYSEYLKAKTEYANNMEELGHTKQQVENKLRNIEENAISNAKNLTKESGLENISILPKYLMFLIDNSKQ